MRQVQREVRRRRARLQLWVAGGVAVLLTCFGLAALLTSEPDESGPYVLAAGAVAAGALAAVVLLAIGIHSGSWIAWMLPVAATCTAVVLASCAEDLHWRWSRGEFGSLDAVDVEACRDGCKVGWWRVAHIEMSDALVEVWLPYETSSCYNGRALVRPHDSSLGAVGVRDQLSVTSNYISVSEWRDSWYKVCITS